MCVCICLFVDMSAVLSRIEDDIKRTLSVNSIVCIHVYMYIHVYIYKCIHVYMYTCIHVYKTLIMYS